jgi:hypothetical protein
MNTKITPESLESFPPERINMIIVQLSLLLPLKNRKKFIRKALEEAESKRLSEEQVILKDTRDLLRRRLEREDTFTSKEAEEQLREAVEKTVNNPSINITDAWVDSLFYHSEPKTTHNLPPSGTWVTKKRGTKYLS